MENNLVHLDEYILAKRVVNDFPNLIQTMVKFHKELRPHSDYIDVVAVMRQLNESIYMMEMSLEVYRQVLSQIKGKDQ